LYIYYVYERAGIRLKVLSGESKRGSNDPYCSTGGPAVFTLNFKGTPS
jgi:hypothetical protein